MMHPFSELVIGGVFLAPFVAYAVASLIIVLPDRQGKSGVPDLNAFAARQLGSVGQWNGYLSRFTSEKVALELPRFKIAYDAGDLISPLKAFFLG